MPWAPQASRARSSSPLTSATRRRGGCGTARHFWSARSSCKLRAATPSSSGPIRTPPRAFLPSCSGTLPASLARNVRTHMQLPTRAGRPTERRASCPPPSSVSATCLPTAYGRSLESLCACKIPVRTAPVTCASVAQQRLRAGIVVPKEIWRLTGALYERLSLGGRDERLFVSYGDEREVREIRECVDTGAALASSGTPWRPRANACVHAREAHTHEHAHSREGPGS